MEEKETAGGSSLTRFIPVFVVFGLVVLDQFTKWLIQNAFKLGESQTVIPGFFDLVFIENRGAAFGFLSQVDSEWVSRGFMIVSIIAVAVIFLVYRSLEAWDKLSRVALVLIGSGALGNLIDRVRFGAVTDFLLFYIDKYHWPAFNVADSCVTVGVCLLAIGMFYGPGEKTPSP